MSLVKDRFYFLFSSTKGLTLVAIALISLITAIFGMLSGPMAEMGISDFIIKLLGLKLVEAEREGRIITLYHAIAMAVVAIETYFITYMIPMRQRQKSIINTTITIGYMATMIGGLGFGYFGHNWILHLIFISGQMLVFFAGTMLAIALWPWKTEYHISGNDYAHTKKGVNLERVAFFTMAVTTLGSALFGAIPGSFYGNGFETFLAEDTIRLVEKTMLQKSIIGHLHIMLTLIGIAITLVVGRWFKFKGILHKIAMPLMIIGTITISIGAWSVVFLEEAHVIIYVGSTLVMFAALLLVIFGFGKLIRTRLDEQGIKKGNFFQCIAALVHDPVKFGPLWQMVFMNFTVSGIGIFMAAKLDEIIRVWPWRVERVVLTGHWHILSGIIATIILFYYVDLIGLKGKVRKWFGWLVILSSDLAFLSVTIYGIRWMFVSESGEHLITEWTLLLTDIGLPILLLTLAALLVWRLIDLFRKKGIWLNELNSSDLESENGEMN